MTTNRNYILGAFLFVFVGLFVQPAQAYRTKVSEEGHTIRWSSKRVELHLDRTFVERFGASIAFESAKLAAREWSEVEGAPAIAIVESEPSQRSRGGASNTIHLMDPWVGEAGQLALTRTVNDAQGTIVGVDILVNGELAIGLLLGPDDQESYDLAAILSHEMGHVLGLDEAPDVPEATMFPEIGPGETHQRTPAEDDLAGINAIYSEQLVQEAACSYAPGVGATRPSTLSSLGVLAGLLVLIVRGRRGRFFDLLVYSSSSRPGR